MPRRRDCLRALSTSIFARFFFFIISFFCIHTPSCAQPPPPRARLWRITGYERSRGIRSDCLFGFANMTTEIKNAQTPHSSNRSSGSGVVRLCIHASAKYMLRANGASAIRLVLAMLNTPQSVGRPAIQDMIPHGIPRPARRYVRRMRWPTVPARHSMPAHLPAPFSAYTQTMASPILINIDSKRPPPTSWAEYPVGRLAPNDAGYRHRHHGSAYRHGGREDRQAGVL